MNFCDGSGYGVWVVNRTGCEGPAFDVEDMVYQFGTITKSCQVFSLTIYVDVTTTDIRSRASKSRIM